MFKKITFYFSFLLLFLCLFTVSSYASTNYPEIPQKYVKQDSIIYTDYNGKTILKLFHNKNNDFAFRLYVADSNLHIFNASVSAQLHIDTYSLNSDTATWSLTGTGSLTAGQDVTIPMNGSFSLKDSTVDVYDGLTGSDVFFPVAPTSVEAVIAEQTPKMAEKVIQTMKIILLCGVGCLAFLMGFFLLVKILSRFLTT